jgi:putative membrane protein
LIRTLLVLTAVVIIGTYWRAYTIRDWWLENLLVFAALLALALSHRRAPLTNAACLLLFVFLCFHEYGAIYSYSNVPTDGVFYWLGGQRNHYDRLVHFLFGLLLTLPIAELWGHATPVKRWQTLLFAFLTIGCASTLYEIIEWIVVLIVDPQLGVEFLGAQGDLFDAEKDQALALGGSLLTCLTLAFVPYKYRRS